MRVDPPVLTSEPLAVDEIGTRELGAKTGHAQPLDRLAAELLGLLSVAEERVAPRFGTGAQLVPVEPATSESRARPSLASSLSRQRLVSSSWTEVGLVPQT